MSRSSVSILYQISPVVLRSRWFSGRKRAAFGGGFRYRIGDAIVQNRAPVRSILAEHFEKSGGNRVLTGAAISVLLHMFVYVCVGM